MTTEGRSAIERPYDRRIEPALVFAEMYRIVYWRRGPKGAGELITGQMERPDMEHLAEEAADNLIAGRPTPSTCGKGSRAHGH